MKHLWWLDTVPFFALGIYALLRRSWSPWFLVGMAMALVGFLCWTTARLQLGKSFTPFPEARALVTHGLYKKIRHPVYFFGFVAYTGLFVALRWPLGMLFFTVMYSFQLFRIRKEEAVLEKALGEEYRRYKARTWF